MPLIKLAERGIKRLGTNEFRVTNIEFKDKYMIAFKFEDNFFKTYMLEAEDIQKIISRNIVSEYGEDKSPEKCGDENKQKTSL